jgi:hypothetical protein
MRDRGSAVPGTNAVELMAQHALGHIPDDLAPPTVRALIRKGMAKTPLDRPASAREFLARLETVAGVAYGPDWERAWAAQARHPAALCRLLLLGHGAGRPGEHDVRGDDGPRRGAAHRDARAPSESAQGRQGPPEAAVDESGIGLRARAPAHRAAPRASIGAGVLGVMMVISGAAAAVYARTSSSPHTHETNSAVLTSATTHGHGRQHASRSPSPTYRLIARARAHLRHRLHR